MKKSAFSSIQQAVFRREIFPLPQPPLLSREEFTAKYFPQYVSEWRSDHKIRMVKNKAGRMHVAMATAATGKQQNTKRQNRITEAYDTYRSMWNSEMESQREHAEPKLL